MQTTRRLIFGISFSLFLFTFSFAQEPNNMKFGKVSTAEVKMKSIESFPEADAVYLMNVGHTFVTMSAGLKLAEERHFRIKVLTEAGQDHADIELPYFAKGRTQYISSIKAMTYYEENGKVIEQKIKNADIFDEDVDGYWRQKKFSMPNVKPGSVIEIRYLLTSEDFTFIRDWYFQKDIPVLYSEFSKEVIEGFYYQTTSKGNLVGINRSNERTSKTTPQGTLDLVKETFKAANIAPLEKEAFVANMSDYASHLTFQLQKISIPGGLYKDYVRTWGQIAYAWDRDMGEYYKSNGATKNELASVELSGDEDKALSEIFHHVQKKYEWSGGLSLYPYPESKNLIKDKKGNGTAINYLLLTLLRETGFEANPMLISTRGNGNVQRLFATIRQFDHVIVAVKQGEEYILLDATGESLPLGMLPYRDLNQEGFMVGAEAYEWLSLTPKHRYKSIKSANLKLATDGSIEGKITCKHEEYSALVERNTLKEVEDRDEYFNEDLTSGFEDAELIDYEVKEEEAIYQPFTTVSDFEINDNVAGSIGGKIYLKPLLDETITDNPFTSEKRIYPIDFGYGRHKMVTYSYILPEGFEVESAPQPIRMVTSDKKMLFQYQAQAMGNMLQVQFIMEIKDNVYAPQQYEEIKAFYDQVIKKHGEQIVLVKKT
ncbi:MAG: DUF3857 domain-containing protein [Bacteroidota bacterium]